MRKNSSETFKYEYVFILISSACASLPPATKLGQGNIFRSMCQEFCSGGGLQANTHQGGCGVWLVGSPGPHPRGKLGVWLGGLQAHTPGGGWESGRGGLQVHTPGCIPACTEADTPSRWLLL